MIDDNFEVWEHGPVIPDVYRKYKQYKYMAIPHENAEKQEEDYGLTPAEKAICDGVIEGLLCYSGKTLEGFTHREPPWQSVDEPNGIIPKEIIQEYFKNVIKRFNMNGPEDIHKYGEYMFAHRYD